MDIFEWLNLISIPHDEWTDDTARLAILIVTRKNYKPYNERDDTVLSPDKERGK